MLRFAQVTKTESVRGAPSRQPQESPGKDRLQLPVATTAETNKSKQVQQRSLKKNGWANGLRPRLRHASACARPACDIRRRVRCRYTSLPQSSGPLQLADRRP